MPYAIVAEFPGGAYMGSVDEGVQDRLPSLARLLSALLSAAGSGVRAVEADAGLLGPCSEDRAALSWLENHPPDGMAIPATATNGARATAYRDLGLLRPKSAGTKRVAKHDHANVALRDTVLWLWADEPPEHVRDALDDLCPDVAYLGRADSPVRLSTTRTPRRPATHERDSHPRVSTRRPLTDVVVAAPRHGRTAALIDAYNDAARQSGGPDRAKSDEGEIRPLTTDTALGLERYVQLGDEHPDGVPWSSITVIPIVDRDTSIPQDQRVAYCVAAHRALISRIGDGAPPLLTGHYDPGASRPANRIALQIIDRHHLAEVPLPTVQALVVAIPHDADAAQRSAVESALAGLRRVRSRRGTLALADVDDRVSVSGARFWRTPEVGLVRVWVSAPVVPDIRAPRGGRWLSLGLVLRDRLADDIPPTLSRDERHRAMVNHVLAAGVDPFDVRRITEGDLTRYAHKVPDGHVVEPYVATIALGTSVPETAWLAIGQSRHLGGGHLAPIDVDPAALDAWRLR